ncbi:MAG: prepilin-type N-terminal cleavage/methylation domain-containing protein [Planctomycetota bacterium]
MCARQTNASAAGFTLMELMTVMALIAILAGLGIGFLGAGTNDMEIAWATIQDQLRLAHETARNSGRPTEVRFTQTDGPLMVQARVLAPVGHWHLEPNEDYYAGLRPELSGTPVENGRYGWAMRADLEEGKTVFAVATQGRARFDLVHGFGLRLEVKLEERVRTIVARFGQAFRIELDDQLVPSATLTLADPGPRPGRRITITGTQPLRLFQWTQLELIHDGQRLLLVVDGLEVARQSARGECYQLRGDLLEVSPGETPLHGLVDEIRLLAYELGEPQNLPPQVALRGFQGPIGFDRRGQLRAPATIGTVIELELDDATEKRSLAPGGVLK